MAFDPSSNEKITFGAVVTPPEDDTSSPRRESTLIAPSTPFYALPSAQPSLQSLPSKKEPTIAVYEADLEAGHPSNGISTPLTSHSALDLPHVMPTPSYATTAMDGYRPSFEGRAKECTVWPTKETLREKARVRKAERQQTRWCGSTKTKWDAMTKKQRLWIRLLVLLIIIAVAVGVGVGVSKAVNGGVYAGQGESHVIASPH